MARELTEAEYDRCIRERLCFCGSMLPKEAQYDARGIFLTYTCEKCEREKLGHYRPDVLTDPNYWADEPIDGDCDDVLEREEGAEHAEVSPPAAGSSEMWRLLRKHRRSK